MNRRHFLKNFTLLSAAASVPRFLMTTLRAARAGGGLGAGQDEPLLVVIELNGGMDGLSALVPYSNDLYHQKRPTLGISASQVLKIDDDFGFHPGMTGLKDLFDQGKLSIIHGVGYPNPNRSHFRAQDIWYTAQPDQIVFDGWLGKYLETLPTGGLRGVSVGGGVSKSLLTADGASPAIRSIERFKLDADPRSAFDAVNLNGAFGQLQSLPRDGAPLLEFAARAALDATSSSVDLLEGQQNYNSTIVYPFTGLGQNLRTAARVMAADLGVRVFYAVLPGFDTHANQIRSDNNLAGRHAALLEEFSQAVKAFHDDLVQMGLWDRTLIVTLSEFGRRLPENGSRGTDHGTANPMFLMGGGVRPGFFGTVPSLAPEDLDGVGDMVFQIDFRQVYATVLQDWLKVDPVPLLGADFPTLEVLV